MFVRLEKPALEQNEANLRENIRNARETFIEKIIGQVAPIEESFLIEQLEKYELAAQEAVEGNLVLSTGNDTVEPFRSKSEKWTMPQAMFFASTVCTTIGYGNIVPATFEGRLFCIFFALIGIPFTLTVIADYGNIFANTVSIMAKKCKSMSENIVGIRWQHFLFDSELQRCVIRTRKSANSRAVNGCTLWALWSSWDFIFLLALQFSIYTKMDGHSSKAFTSVSLQ